MSIVVKFFAAPDDTSAALALPTGPVRAFESLSFGNFDPEEAVVEWECLLAGGRFEELVEAHRHGDRPRDRGGSGRARRQRERPGPGCLLLGRVGTRSDECAGNRLRPSAEAVDGRRYGL
ncbi:hypothetical protein [Streptomyces sp. ISL-99]|uniref:hypothetical protein n=1 Tax=Streptomyces sp. ISL-99 TaxID=2819193 RepID=UPI0027E52FD8|nr:hypothetical protein [Streptomyces sp. ISL-99]